MSALKNDLVGIVSHVRDQLEELDRQRQDAGKEALFQLSALELEFHFAVIEDTSAKGGFDLKIVSLGGSTDLKAEEVQKVRIKFDVASEASTAGRLGTRAYPTVSRRGGEKDVKPLE
jgi:hypothetical protein